MESKEPQPEALQKSESSAINRCHDPDYQFYVQILVVFATLLVCLIGIIVDPTSPNVRYFQSAASFCLGLILPNPKQSDGGTTIQPHPGPV